MPLEDFASLALAAGFRADFDEAFALRFEVEDEESFELPVLAALPTVSGQSQKLRTGHFEHFGLSSVQVLRPCSTIW